MKKIILIAFFGAFMTASLFGQKDETLFHKLRLTGAWGGSAWNFAQIDESYETLAGGYGGLEFSKDIFVGWGSLTTVGDFFISDLTNDRYRMAYNGLILGYSPKAHKSLHLQTNLLTGAGNIRNLETGTNDNFFVLQPYLGVEANVVRWMRVGLGGGYRAVFNNDFPTTPYGNLSNGFAEVRFKFGWSWGR
jgi:hypothetical protein